MKKLTRVLFCMLALTLLLCTSAMAAEGGVSILLNGQAVEFTDAAPQIVNNRTYLPFRTVFNALGFADDAITFDAQTKTVSAANEALTVSMVIGDNHVSVTQNGETTVLDTDVPAFIDAKLSRTYVPARFVSEAVGYRVGWNGATRCVIIDDVDSILSANKETYSVLEKLLAYSRPLQTGTYQTDGDYHAAAVIAGSDVSYDGTFSMLVSGSAADFSTVMNITGTADGVDMSAAYPDGLDMDMYMNVENGCFYLRSNALMTMLESGMSNVWLKLDVPALLGSTGLDYQQLLASSKASQSITSGKELFDTSARLILESDSTVSANEAVAMLNAMLSDKAFVKTGSNYVSTFEQDGMKMEMTILCTGSKVCGYSVTISGAVASEAVSMTILLKDDAANSAVKNMTAEIGMDVLDMPMQVNMSAKYVPSTKTPVGAPAADAAVMDVMELLGSLLAA